MSAAGAGSRPNCAAAIVVAEENAAAALEVMSRFALAPQWLAYLPPTMSPSETSKHEGWLERPEEAFEHFRKNGVGEVVCEEKHMGSRAIIALCRDAAAARTRFGVTGDATGAIWTRTGRGFFADAQTTEAVLARLRDVGRAHRCCGTNSRPTGCCSTPRSCPGRPRPAR